MAKPQTIGNRLAPPRFIAFMATLLVAVLVSNALTRDWATAIMAGFDIAAMTFLLLCLPLLATREAETIRRHAKSNDANRRLLLGITGIVMIVLLIAVAAETVGHNPEPSTRALIIATFVVAWLFSNTVYALHYAHMAYVQPEEGCSGFRFPDTPEPAYWDFIYFAFTCGMAFATSDVIVTDQRVRKVVTLHCLAAFAFNIGVIGFTVNLLASRGG